MSIPLLSTILALIAWAAVSHDRERMVAGCALLGNLLTCWAMWRVTGEGFDPLALFAVDFTTAVLLILATQSRPPLAISFIYLLQCLMHGAVCALGGDGSKHEYAIGLEVLAWAQVLILGGWGGYLAYRRNFQLRHRGDGAQPSGAAATSVASESPRP